MLFFFFFFLESFEALAIDSNDCTLRDKRLGVDFIDQCEDTSRLRPSCQHEQHVHIAARIETLSLDECAAPVDVVVDLLANLIVFLCDDEELHRPSRHIHHLVYAKSRDEEHHISVDDLFPVAQHQITRGDDQQVGNKDGMSERDVLIFVDYSRHDVGPARAAMGRETYSHSASPETCPHHRGHKKLVAQQLPVAHQISQDGDESREQGYSIDGLDAETQSQGARCR